MTVSRTLRGEARMTAATRDDVLALAESMGYRPGPDLARLMQRARSSKRTQFRSAIAVIRESVPGDDMLSPSPIRGARTDPVPGARPRLRGRGVPARPRRTRPEVSRQITVPPPAGRPVRARRAGSRAPGRIVRRGGPVAVRERSRSSREPSPCRPTREP